MSFELAQVNVSRLLAPLDSPQLKEFVDALEPVNAVADAAPGFRWRLQSEAGDATSIPVFGDAWMIINMSVWESPEALLAYVYGDAHRAVLRGRRQWFHHPAEAMTALWWVPQGHRPSVAEAEQRLEHLRSHGPSPHVFTLKQTYAATEALGVGPAES